eukprot:9951528-Lingulodinium_polyedra.AAC.1
MAVCYPEGLEPAEPSAQHDSGALGLPGSTSGDLLQEKGLILWAQRALDALVPLDGLQEDSNEGVARGRGEGPKLSCTGHHGVEPPMPTPRSVIEVTDQA